MMDLVITGRDDKPFQPARSPGDIHVHPVVTKDVLRDDELKNP
jgi:hypothetical protein